MNHLRKFFPIAAVLIAALFCTPAFAQSYPTRTVTIIVPFGAGSVTDAMARVLADKLSATWKQSVVVENKPGLPGTAPLPSAATRDPKLWKTASDFESMFLESMFGHMTSGLTGEGPLGGEGAGGEIWRGMLTKEYAGTVTRAGGIGIASNIYNELLKLQGGAHAAR